MNRQGAERPWSIAQRGDVTRFELRAGERRPQDPPTRDRSEISGEPWEASRLVTIAFKRCLTKPRPFTSADMIVGQVHDMGKDVPHPAVAWHVRPDGSQRITVNEVAVWTGKPQYGLWLDWQAEVLVDPVNGLLSVWRNGKRLVKYAGPVGYGRAEANFKFGIYRAAAKETAVAEFACVSVS